LLGFHRWGVELTAEFRPGKATSVSDGGKVFIVDKSTIKSTHNSFCELLGGYQKSKTGVLYGSCSINQPVV